MERGISRIVPATAFIAAALVIVTAPVPCLGQAARELQGTTGSAPKE
jgi:hypothetical protein